MVKQVVSLQPKEDHARADTHPGAGMHALMEDAAHGELLLKQDPGRSCGPWGTHTGAVS